MSLVTNIDAIVAPELAVVPGSVSARLGALRTRMPARALSPAGEERLRALVRAAAPAREGTGFHPIDSGNPGASYAEACIPVADGAPVRARLIMPRAYESPSSAGERAHRDGAGVPLVLAFHDAGRPVRGWHHLARFAALGCAVLALDAGTVPPGDAVDALPALAAPALATAQAGFGLPGVDAARACTWGEGLGGALALIVAAAWPERIGACAVQNPFPLDDPALPDHVDAACLVTRLRCRLLVGTALMDELAPAEAQAALANGAAGSCRARQIFYSKFAHERINDFEDEVLRFLCFE